MQSEVPALNIVVAPAPAPKQVLAPTTEMNISGSLTINTESLAAIAVTKAETAIRERIASLNSELSAIASIVFATRSEADAHVNGYRTAIQSARPFAALVESPAFRELFPNFTPQETYSVGACSDSTDHTVTCTLRNQGLLYDVDIARSYRVPRSKAHSETLDRLAAAQKQEEAIRADLLRARASLTQLSVIERRAKAAIAESIARQSTEGSKVCDELNRALDVDALIKSLV